MAKNVSQKEHILLNRCVFMPFDRAKHEGDFKKRAHVSTQTPSRFLWFACSLVSDMKK